MPIYKAVEIKQWGSREDPVSGIEIADRPVPTPGAGEVLVRIYLRPINPSDVFSLAGFYMGFRPKSLPAVAGLEGVGRVESNGEGASTFSKGQRVVSGNWGAYGGNGTWQQYLVVPESSLIAVPDSVSDEAAAQFLVNPVTVLGFVELTAVPDGEYLLQNAANSVLGKQLIALAKKRGIRTINLVRNKAYFEELKALGADELIDTSSEDVPKRVKEITGGKGAWAAVDPIGGDIAQKITQSLRDDGTLLVYSSMAGMTSNVGIPDLLYRGVKVRGFWLGPWMQKESGDPKRVLKEVMGLLADGTIQPEAGEKFSITDIEQVKKGVTGSREPGRKGKYFLEG